MDNLNQTYRPTRYARHAMTLVELLVVVLLLGIVMGIAATAVKNGTKGKKLREASRQVNAFIAGAQARAIETGRPVGIEIVRNANEPRAGLEIYLKETPVTYAGDTTDARLQIVTRGPFLNDSTMTSPPAPGYPGRYYTLEDQSGFSASMRVLIKNDDLIQLNFRGAWYEISSLSSNSFKIFVPQIDNTFNYNYGDPGGDFVRYKVQRQPLRSSVTPLQMPTDTCVDLAFSGMGIEGQGYHPIAVSDGSRIGFTFNSRGGIDRFYYPVFVYDSNGKIALDGDGNPITTIASNRPTGTIYLLIGRYDGLISMTDVEGTNLFDYSKRSTNSLQKLLIAEGKGELEDPSNISNLNSIWVSINHLTGKITTSNNAFVDIDLPKFPDPTSNGPLLAEARRLSKEAYNITGRGGQ